MWQDQEVTFGGTGLDRLAQQRGDATALGALMTEPGARTLLYWRGNVLIEGGEIEGGEADRALARLPLDHPVLAEALGAAPILLGRSADGAVIFAQDMSAWQPPELEHRDAPLGWTVGGLPQHPALAEGQGFSDLRAIMADLTPEEAELAATARGLFSWHQSHRFCARCGQPSKIVEAGWQRRCPTCQAQHFPRTDPVVIMLIARGENVLLGRSHGWPEGMWSVPAGFVEPGETIEAAVRREVLEETAVEVGEVRYVCCQPWPFPNSLMFGCRGTALSEAITVDPVELEDAMWLSREELATVFAGDHPMIRRPRRGAIAEFLLRNWLADRLA